MRQTLLFISLLILISLLSCNAGKNNMHQRGISKVNQKIAFPGAEGFGQYATGGRGGKVLFVTNLNDAGEGSLRQAVETEGPRYILFKISGTIALQSPLRINQGNVTIAGQSAPGDGICLKNFPVSIAADNVIIRFLRFRMGDEKKREDDALGSRFHKNFIIDHCSMSWSSDECVSIYGNENTTLQWCIISESLNHSFHHKGSHGFGGIWGGKNVSFHHNLLAHHSSRNPRLGERAGEPFALTDLVDLRNNVIYNWGYNSCYGGEAMNVNIVNCYYKPGPASKCKERIVEIWKNEKPETEIYNIWGKFFVEGNYVEGSKQATEDNWTYGVEVKTKSNDPVSEDDFKKVRIHAEHPISENVNTDSPQMAYQKVLAHAGASLIRDRVDRRIIDNVKKGDYSFEGSKEGKMGIIDSQEDVGGYPVLQSLPAPDDTSGDGMPDEWKQRKGLSPARYEANGHNLHPHYENIEVYLNELVQSIISKTK